MTSEPIPAFDTVRLATTKTGSGKVYVIAYKGKWHSSKKQVRTEYKEYIGALDAGTARVRPSNRNNSSNVYSHCVACYMFES